MERKSDQGYLEFKRRQDDMHPREFHLPTDRLHDPPLTENLPFMLHSSKPPNPFRLSRRYTLKSPQCLQLRLPLLPPGRLLLLFEGSSVHIVELLPVHFRCLGSFHLQPTTKHIISQHALSLSHTPKQSPSQPAGGLLGKAEQGAGTYVGVKSSLSIVNGSTKS